MKELWRSINGPCVILGLAVFFYYHSTFLPPPRFEPMGPAFFPQLVLRGIMLFCLYDLIQGIRRYFLRRLPAPAEACPPAEKRRQAGLLGLTVALFTLYLLAVTYTDIPFLLLSFVFMFILCFLLSGCQKRCLKIIALASAGVTGAVYLVFGLLLQTFFP